MEPELMSKAQDNFKEAGEVDEFISLFGIGDGGGGPRRDYIERAMRMKDLEGCPKVTMGTAEGFFERLNEFKGKLDTWSGELYLEKHQGTLTTQAKVKEVTANSNICSSMSNLFILVCLCRSIQLSVWTSCGRPF